MKDVHVTVDTTRSAGQVNRMVLGQNAEWLNFNHPLLFDGESLSAEVVEACRRLGASSLRFPGGCPGDYYHWRDAVGPRTGRKAAPSCFEDAVLEQRFGTDELIALCRATGAVPWLQTNPIDEGADSMVAWARHFRDAGVPAGHWELGNELYIANPADDSPNNPNNARIAIGTDAYIEHAGAQARALREDDPDAVIGAVMGYWGDFQNPFYPDWNERVITELGGLLDFVAVHNAYGPGAWEPGWWEEHGAARLVDLYLAAAALPEHVRRLTEQTLAFLDDRAPKPLGIAVTEWLPFFGTTAEGPLHSGTMGAALYTAGMLHTFLREPRVIAAHFMSYVQLGFGACITIGPEGLFNSVNGVVLELYARRLGDTLLATEVACDSFDVAQVGAAPPLSGIAEVDALATRGADGEITVFLVNRRLEEPVCATVEGAPAGAAPGVEVVAGRHFLECNGPLPIPTTLARPRPSDDPIRAVPGTAQGAGPWQVELPPASVSAVRWARGTSA